MTQLVDIRVPQDDQQGTHHVLANWLKTPGEPVTANMPLVDLETDKVMVEVAAPASGILKEVLKKPGEDVEPGTLLGRIEIGLAELPSAPVITYSNIHVEPTPTNDRREGADKMLLSPAVRRLVKTHHLDLSAIHGSGRRGRVTKQDIHAYLKQRKVPVAEDLPVLSSTETAPQTPTTGPPSTRIPHDAMRRRIAAHMTESLLHTAPHVTTVFEADLSAIVRHRNQYKASFEQQGTKLTFSAYFVTAAVKALEWVPRVNSRFHADSLELFADMNIGIGTALDDRGLIVPVLQRAQTRNLLGIAAELQRLTEAARSGTLEPADLQGGTFTLSNHGVSGSLVATPIIINQPQTAILGIGKLEKRVIVREIDGNDSILIRPMAYVTLTIDHRALDAYQANRFMTRFVEVIENWNAE
ncbi:dihydrolipoamide acetyltransferase family protein [Sedimenticola sp.]|uniref:dihydrolipoamide acetyltransferase family protein n=1 Tax=Sedimenticola sp. TaxID=1940285 RepID=UPI003D0F7BEA